MKFNLRDPILFALIIFVAIYGGDLVVNLLGLTGLAGTAVRWFVAGVIGWKGWTWLRRQVR